MYKFTIEQTAMGVSYEFVGPGMPMYANNIHPQQPNNEWAAKHADPQMEAERIAHLLACAYEAGRQAAKMEIREVLGVPRRG